MTVISSSPMQTGYRTHSSPPLQMKNLKNQLIFLVTFSCVTVKWADLQSLRFPKVYYLYLRFTLKSRCFYSSRQDQFAAQREIAMKRRGCSRMNRRVKVRKPQKHFITLQLWWRSDHVGLSFNHWVYLKLLYRVFCPKINSGLSVFR